MHGPSKISATAESVGQQQRVTSCPKLAPARWLAGLHRPVYIINVKVVDMKPNFKDAPYRLVRGHCSHFSCNRTLPIEWDKSGPERDGKLLRPYCPQCFTGERKRHYLDLHFYLEMKVTDKSCSDITVIVQGEPAERFFGCSVYTFLTDKDCAIKVQRKLSVLRQSCLKRPGLEVELRVTPVACDKVNEDVQFHLCGNNKSLDSIVTRNAQ